MQKFILLFPQEIFIDGILERTIVGFIYTPPGHTIFKEGWRPDVVLNLKHPNWVAFMDRSRLEQQEILDRRGHRISWEDLNRLIGIAA